MIVPALIVSDLPAGTVTLPFNVLVIWGVFHVRLETKLPPSTSKPLLLLEVKFDRVSPVMVGLESRSMLIAAPLLC